MLERFTYNKKNGWNTWMRSPHTINVNGKTCTIASTGEMMVLLQQDRYYPPIPEDAHKSVMKNLTAKQEHLANIALSQLKDWAGEPIWDRCESCQGTNRVSRSCDYCDEKHQCICYECRNYQINKETPEAGIIAGKAVSRLYIARALSAMPPAETTIKIEIQEPDESKNSPGWVTFSAFDWKVLVAFNRAPATSEMIELPLQTASV